MGQRVPKGLWCLPGKSPSAGIGNGARDHYWQLDTALLKYLLYGENRSLGVEGGSVVTLFTPDELVDRADRAPSAFPVDAFIDVGLRVESEIGVMGLSIGNFFLLADP